MVSRICPEILDSDVFSIRQACDLLGISKQTLYRAVKAGPRRGGIDARPRRDNGRLQVSGKELRRFLRG